MPGVLVYIEIHSLLLWTVTYQVNIIVLAEGINNLLCIFDFFLICRILKICFGVLCFFTFLLWKIPNILKSKEKNTVHPLVFITQLPQLSAFCQSCFTDMASFFLEDFKADSRHHRLYVFVKLKFRNCIILLNLLSVQCF